MSQGNITYRDEDATFDTAMLPFDDMDGRVKLQCKAHTALTALTPYKAYLREDGWVSAALTSNVGKFYVIVPLETVSAANDLFYGVIGGPVDDVITPSLSVSAGHAFYLTSAGAIGDANIDYTGMGTQFAICATVSTSSTTQDMILVPVLHAESDENGMIVQMGTGSEYAVSGTYTEVYSATADTKFMQFWLDGAATSGTHRGIYIKLLLTGGAGGEAARFYTTVINNTPADTCNGAHISLGFGTSVGNITGLGTAVRATIMVPARALTGTTAGVMSEYYATATTSTCSGSNAFFSAVISGDATGADLLAVNTYLFNISGPSAMVGDTALVRTNTNAATHGVKCLINGTRYDMLVSTAHS